MPGDGLRLAAQQRRTQAAQGYGCSGTHKRTLFAPVEHRHCPQETDKDPGEQIPGAACVDLVSADFMEVQSLTLALILCTHTRTNTSRQARTNVFFQLHLNTRAHSHSNTDGARPPARRAGVLSPPHSKFSDYGRTPT